MQSKMEMEEREEGRRGVADAAAVSINQSSTKEGVGGTREHVFV